MINLASLSALIRSLRHNGGIDAPATPVPRVASVTPVAADDAGAMTSTVVRTATSSRTATIGIEADGAEHTASRPGRDVLALATASTAAAARSAVAANSPTAEPPRSTALDFTDGARLLQAALRGTGLRTPTPPAITSEKPLVFAANSPAHELARGLANAVAGSGLFYESHLARALQRDYPAAALAREPQSSWTATAMTEFASSTANAALPEAASSMLTRQLDALDTRALLWTGDVWPGQRATIGFSEQEHAREANDPDVIPPAAAWKLRLSIDLPTLGRVEATLDLRADTLDVALAAPSGETQRRLASARDELTSSLADANVTLARFDVRADPEP